MSKSIVSTLLLALLILPQYSFVLGKSDGITPVDLKISLDEVIGVDLAYNLSTFEPIDAEYKLKVERSVLTDGTINIPLSSINPVLRSLHSLYPGTRPLSFWSWTDDYPFAEIKIWLKDGRCLLISSESQYGYMTPWNVQIWQGDPAGDGSLLNAFALLHADFTTGLSAFWQRLAGEPFPRDYTWDDYWDTFTFGGEKKETLVFYVPERYDGFSSDASTIEINGIAPEAVIKPFLPLLEQNDAISSLFAQGYTVYDLAFDMTVTIEGMKPKAYSGSIALASPDGRDVIVSTVKIQLEPEVVIETPLSQIQVDEQINRRRGFAFLLNAEKLLPGIVFLLDVRKDVKPITLDCPANSDVYADYAIKATLSKNSDMPVAFYRSEKLNAWSVDLSLDRERNGFWDSELAKTIVSNWFPSQFSSLSPGQLQRLWMYQYLEVAFIPNLTDSRPELIDLLRSTFPKEATIHVEHPQKQGDMTLALLEGRTIIPEDGSEPKIVYCGQSRPDWMGLAYRVNEVVVPNGEVRSDFGKPSVDVERWTNPRGLRLASDRLSWTSIGVSQPGFIHLLWTDDDNVYYADGWADGTEWTEAQRLGDDSWDIKIATNKAGEVHLLWSADNGSMHVWRDARGKWQEPEFWKHIGFFSQIILDDSGILHLGYKDFDGLDEEFFYQEWSKGNGLSEPENVSRRIGDGGSGGVIQLDPDGNVYAAWLHPLSESQYIDPLSGQIFDRVGVFYSRRLGCAAWTMPEQIGTLASFAYSMDFALVNHNQPVIAWQSEEGILARTFENGRWASPQELAEARLPEEPAPFGPERWGEVTAEIKLESAPNGIVFAAWATVTKGVFLSEFDGKDWTTPLQVSDAEQASALNVVVGLDNVVHMTYFYHHHSASAPLVYCRIENGEVQTSNLPIYFTEYGIEESQLIVDDAGFIYVLGLPRTPSWTVYIPREGVQHTRIAPPSVSAGMKKYESKQGETVIALLAILAITGLLSAGLIVNSKAKECV